MALGLCALYAWVCVALPLGVALWGYGTTPPALAVAGRPTGPVSLWGAFAEVLAALFVWGLPLAALHRARANRPNAMALLGAWVAPVTQAYVVGRALAYRLARAFGRVLRALHIAVLGALGLAVPLVVMDSLPDPFSFIFFGPGFGPAYPYLVVDEPLSREEGVFLFLGFLLALWPLVYALRRIDELLADEPLLGWQGAGPRLFAWVAWAGRVAASGVLSLFGVVLWA